MVFIKKEEHHKYFLLIICGIIGIFFFSKEAWRGTNITSREGMTRGGGLGSNRREAKHI